ncbi:MAG: TetR/AcrR family transcriptional regulator [Defluviitaleaceae bacterium]|nr:TetR/AcrR family transcriptional regulator [Defluviitaleaceae bacterium]
MPRRDPSEKTKEEIIQTAVRLFREKGWNSVNIEDVVKELGVTRGAFYHYFKSREDLVYLTLMRLLTDDNPLLLASQQEGLNALEKMRFGLKQNFKTQLMVAQTSNIKETMDDPVVLKSYLHYCVKVAAPYIEKLLEEGNIDGSTSAKYPKHTAQAAVLMYNEWLNPTIYQMSEQEFSERLLFLKQFGEQMGIPILDDELRGMLMQNYEICKSN